MAAASNGSEFFELEIENESGFFSRPSNAEALEEDENELLLASIECLPSQKRSTTSFLDRSPSEQGGGNPRVTETIDVRKLDRTARELLVKKALVTSDQDNYRLLSSVKERLHRVGLEVPKVEVWFKGLNVMGDIQTGLRALPTLVNFTRDMIKDILTEEVPADNLEQCQWCS